MTRAVPATPVLSGADAAAVRHEIAHGSPNTPARLATIRGGEAAVRAMGGRTVFQAAGVSAPNTIGAADSIAPSTTPEVQ